MDTPERLDSVRCRMGPVGALTAPQMSPSQRRCGTVLSCKQGPEPHDEEFKATDTSSTWQACKRIKSQMSFSQIQGRLLLVLFTQTSQHKRAHAGHVSHTSCCQHLLQQGLNTGQNSCTWCRTAVCIWFHFARSSKWRWGLSSTAGISCTAGPEKTNPFLSTLQLNPALGSCPLRGGWSNTMGRSKQKRWRGADFPLCRL